METAIIMLGVNGALSTTALVYVVRRVAPQPKLPAAPAQATGSRSSRRTPPAEVPGQDQTANANGSAATTTGSQT